MKTQRIQFTDPETNKTVDVDLYIGDFYVDIEICPTEFNEYNCCVRTEFYDGKFRAMLYPQSKTYSENEPNIYYIGESK